jgi:hypothetical protein
MRPKTISRLWVGSLVVGYTAAMIGAVVGMAAKSDLLIDMMIILLILGLSIAHGVPMSLLIRQYTEQRKVLIELVDAFRGEASSENREALLTRLNRLAAENKELVEAMGKVVVPIVVALVAFTGVVLTVVLRD